MSGCQRTKETVLGRTHDEDCDLVKTPGDTMQRCTCQLTSNQRTHELKTWPEFFVRLVRGDKTFELRKDDRGFRCGDTLLLREWEPHPGRYTGRELRKLVTYVMSGPAFGLLKDWVCMGLTDETAAPLGEFTGMKVYVDPTLKPGTVEFRDAEGNVRVRMDGLRQLVDGMAGKVPAEETSAIPMHLGWAEEERKCLLQYHDFHGRQMPDPEGAAHRYRAAQLRVVETKASPGPHDDGSECHC